MSWLKSHWRKLVVGACGIIGAGAQVTPVLLPAAAVCALVVPVILAGGSGLDAVRAAIGKPANVTPPK